jgi:hypothetical protein
MALRMDLESNNMAGRIDLLPHNMIVAWIKVDRRK